MEYRNRLYQSYVQTQISRMADFSPEAMERHRWAFRHYFGSLLPSNRDARILELGCGYGRFLYYLQREGYQNSEGIDISSEQVEVARRLGLENAIQGDAVELLKKRGATYEAIVAIDFLEHFPKTEVLGLLETIYGGLKPGGVFIMQSPNADGPFAGRYRYWDFSHEFALTGQSTHQILGVTGFQDVRVFPAEPYVHGVASFLRACAWHVIKAGLWVYLVAETGGMRDHILTQNLIASARK